MINQLHRSTTYPFKKPVVSLSLVSKPSELIKAPDELLLFVESPGLIVELVKTAYGYKVCKAACCRHFGGQNAAVEAADYFLGYVND